MSPPLSHLLPPILATLTTFSLLLLLFLFIHRRLTRHLTLPKPHHPLLPLPHPHPRPRPRPIPFSLLKKTTLSFSPTLLLGHGSFGPVFLSPPLTSAVKLSLSPSSPTSLSSFHNEVTIHSSLSPNPHVVRLTGFCKSKHLCLVYELMENGSLQNCLECNHFLNDWKVRVSVCIDVAKGLSFLHHDCCPPVVHGDVKASNVLLDANFKAKLSDFGLARFKVGDGDGGDDKLNTKKVNGCCGESNDGAVVIGVEDSGVETESFTTVTTGVGVETSPEVEMVTAKASPLEYVIEWIGGEVGKGGSGEKGERKEEKKEKEKEKRKTRLDWWVRMEEGRGVAKKEKRRPVREWWKEEYSEELAREKKKKKKKKEKRKMYQRGEAVTDNEDNWWDRDEESCSDRRRRAKKSRSRGSSRGSVDWWLDGFSGDLWKGREPSCDSMSGEIPKSGGISSTPSMRGTVCYIAPECSSGGELSEKCDIYSFGVLLLVIIAGRRPLQLAGTGSPMSEFHQANLISWARKLARSGKVLDLVDKRILSLDKEQAQLFILVALNCLQKVPDRRPSMKEVVGMLTGELDPPKLPVEYTLPASQYRHKSRKKLR